MDKELLVGKLNELLKMFFEANAIFDNIAYSLDCELKCQNTSKSFHQNVAHVIVGDNFADKLSDKMIENSIRPNRKGIETYDKVYDNIIDCFNDVVATFLKLKEYQLELLSVLDGDYEYKSISLIIEEILLDTQKMLKQAYIWQEKAILYQDNVKSFDVRFEKFWR